MDQKNVKSPGLIVFSILVLLFSIPMGAEPTDVRVDNFSTKLEPWQFPAGWGMRQFFPLFGKDPQSSVEFNGDQNFIRLKTGPSSSFLIGNRTRWNLFDTPYLQWDWKVGSFPDGGNIKARSTDDAAGSFCVAHGVSVSGFKESLCYLFGNEEKKGEHFPYYQNPGVHYIVLRSRSSGETTGSWYSEKRNVLEDFTREFGHAPPAVVYLAMWIDSNNTSSSSEIYYRNIYFKSDNDNSGQVAENPDSQTRGI